MARDVEYVSTTGSPLEFRLCNFATGGAQPLPAHQEFIKSYLVPNVLVPNPAAWIDLVGSASKLGFASGDSEAKNRILSDKRVGSIRQLIQNQATNRINVAVGLGDTQSGGPPNDNDGYYRAVLVRVFGVGSAPVPPSPVPLPVPKEWFVTSLSLSTFAAIVAVGFTAATGTITFERPNGDSITLPIGLFGPSVGLSVIPDIGNLLAKLPGLATLLSRFPALKQFIMPNAVPLLSNDLLKFVITTRNPIARLFFDHPVIRAQVQRVLTGLSGGAQDWWSAAIGEVFGKGGRELSKGDFSGPCICYSVGGAVGPGNFGIFALFFGLDRNALDLISSNPLLLIDLTQLEAHAKGFAIISSASASASIPGLGAGATVFFGEIV
jgi:hypothetical protein